MYRHQHLLPSMAHATPAITGGSLSHPCGSQHPLGALRFACMVPFSPVTMPFALPFARSFTCLGGTHRAVTATFCLVRTTQPLTFLRLPFGFQEGMPATSALQLQQAAPDDALPPRWQPVPTWPLVHCISTGGHCASDAAALASVLYMRITLLLPTVLHTRALPLTLPLPLINKRAASLGPSQHS